MYVSEITWRKLAMMTEQERQEPDFFVVVTSAGIWQSFHKCRADAEFITSKAPNPGYSILEIYTAPPVPVIKLPGAVEFNKQSKTLAFDKGFSVGFNECIEEIKNLNGLGE